MKTILFSALVIFGSALHAVEVSSSEVTLTPSTVSEVQHFTLPSEDGTSQRLSIITTEDGMSTDVYPRYAIYLGYASYAEMGNISTNFSIGRFVEVTSVRQKSAGIFEIKALRITEEGMPRVTLTVDARQVLADEKKLRESCNDDFCDKDLDSKINVTETVDSE